MFKSIAFYAVARMLSGLLLYLSFLAILYGLDRQEYQYFSISYPVYQILTLTCFGWIAAIVPPQFAGIDAAGQARAQRLLLRAFGWTCLVALTALIAARVIGAVQIPWSVLIALAMLTIAGSASDDVLVVANTRRQHRPYVLLSAVRYGGGLALALMIFAWPGIGAAGALGALATGAALSVAAWWRNEGKLHHDCTPGQPGEMMRWFIMGLPAIIAFSVYQLSMSASRLMLASSCSLAAAATLGGVNDFLSGPILLVFQVINLAMNPLLYDARNRGDQAAFRKTAFTTVALQLAVIVPAALLLFVAGRPIGNLLLSGRLGPMAPAILPMVGVAVLLSVSLNTAIVVALARRKAAAMALFGLAIIAAATVLAAQRGCDLVGFSRGFAILMGISGAAGLALIYRLTRAGATD